jgi:hypothetical protein
MQTRLDAEIGLFPSCGCFHACEEPQAGGSTVITSPVRPAAQQRRSQRILLSVSILISGQQANGSPFSERTKTQVVNAHGALIQLREPVLAGQQLRMKNLATNEEVACTVADISRGSTEVPEVGVAFTKPCPGFWRVTFPPEDWSPRSPEAKRVSYVTQPKPVLVKK